MAWFSRKGNMTPKEAVEATAELSRIDGIFQIFQQRVKQCMDGTPTRQQAEACNYFLNDQTIFYKSWYTAAQEDIVWKRLTCTTIRLPKLRRTLRVMEDSLKTNNIPAIALFLLSAGIAYIAARRTDTAA